MARRWERRQQPRWVLGGRARLGESSPLQCSFAQWTEAIAWGGERAPEVFQAKQQHDQ